MKKIYGTRICKSCRGICHRNSYRKNYGTRRSYWCSKNCLEWKIIKSAEEKLPLCIRYKHLIEKDVYPTQAFVDHIIDEFYEKVDVITK